MLAVHEQRISKQEEIDEVLFDKIDKLRDKMDSDHDPFVVIPRSIRIRLVDTCIESRTIQIISATTAV